MKVSDKSKIDPQIHTRQTEATLIVKVPKKNSNRLEPTMEKGLHTQNDAWVAVGEVADC